MEVSQMQMVHNNLISNEENEKIERELDMTAAQILESEEKQIDKDIEEDKNTFFNPFAMMFA